jgi:hypothetical protein
MPYENLFHPALANRATGSASVAIPVVVRWLLCDDDFGDDAPVHMLTPVGPRERAGP